MWDIRPPPPQQWELRVVVWRTQDVMPHDTWEGMNDMYAVVKVGSATPQQTDVHWRCANGSASFNWRRALELPCIRLVECVCAFTAPLSPFLEAAPTVNGLSLAGVSFLSLSATGGSSRSDSRYRRASVSELLYVVPIGNAMAQGKL